MKDKLIKVMCWRILSISITFALLFTLTGDVKSSTGTTLLLHCLLTVTHFVFEMMWEDTYENR